MLLHLAYFMYVQASPVKTFQELLSFTNMGQY